MRTIIVAEDDADLRALFCEILEGAGYRVRIAESGETALHHLAEEERVDLVVTDLGMPRMDGPALLAALGQLDPDLPAIVLSGADAPAPRPGVVTLQKPIRARELLDAVAALLGA